MVLLVKIGFLILPVRIGLLWCCQWELGFWCYQWELGFWLIICRGFESWVLIIGLNPIDKIALPWIWIMGFNYRVESHWQNSITMNLNHGLWLWTWIMDLNSIDKIIFAMYLNYGFFFSNIAKHKNSWALERMRF